MIITEEVVEEETTITKVVEVARHYLVMQQGAHRLGISRGPDIQVIDYINQVQEEQEGEVVEENPRDGIRCSNNNEYLIFGRCWLRYDDSCAVTICFLWAALLYAWVL